MRKHLALVTGHDDPDMVGMVKITDTQIARVEKNKERPVDTLNVETNERGSYKAVGLGYHDFGSESDYKERIQEVVETKLSEIDNEHLEKAGVDVDD